MLNLESIGYVYPIKAYLFGFNIRLQDAQNRIIFRIDSFQGGHSGRDKIYAIMNEIEKLFNESHEKERKALLLGEKAGTGSGVIKSESESKSEVESKDADEGHEKTEREKVLTQVKRGRGRPRNK